MNTTVIQARKLSFGYPDRPALVDGINLSVSKGEFIGIIGPSGAGKTTLLRLLSGYLRPAGGQVSDNLERRIDNLPPQERARLVALVPQELFTPAPYTVNEMVFMGRAAARSRFTGMSQSDRNTVNEAMDCLEIAHLAEHRFTCLSGGEKQRCVIAMALAQQSEVIMLDEPTSALDIGKSMNLLRLLEKLNREKGVTIVMVSHDLQMLARHCRRLLFFSEGQVQCDGAPGQVVTPEAIKKLFKCDVELLHDDQNRPVICPRS